MRQTLKKHIKSTFKGSSILEALISISIISIIVVLSMVLFNNIQSSNKSFSRLKGYSIALEEIENAIENKLFFDENKQLENYSVSRKITRSEKYPGILKLEVSIYFNNNSPLIYFYRFIRFSE